MKRTADGHRNGHDTPPNALDIVASAYLFVRRVYMCVQTPGKFATFGSGVSDACFAAAPIRTIDRIAVTTPASWPGAMPTAPVRPGNKNTTAPCAQGNELGGSARWRPIRHGWNYGNV